MSGRCGAEAEADGGEDPADGAGAQAVSEPDRFALDVSVSPGGVLLRQAQLEVTDLVTEGWAAGLIRVGPLLRDQAAVPG